jgi:hypothetical protein
MVALTTFAERKPFNLRDTSNIGYLQLEITAFFVVNIFILLSIYRPKNLAMKIAQKFNKLTVKEYIFYIDNYKKYTDFNTLGLYRSILENEKLELDDKIAVRDYAHKTFKKSFDFLQLKDPVVFIEVSTLGQTLTVADENQLWKDLRHSQERILADKKIKHRNFGTYSKHDCGDDTCFMNGVMLKKGTRLGNMHFSTDKNRWPAIVRSDKRKADRKNMRQIIKKELENGYDQSAQDL